MIHANLAEPRLPHQTDDVVGRKKTEIILGHGMLLHLLLRSNRYGRQAIGLEDSVDLAQTLECVRPEINCVDRKHAGESGIGKWEMSNVPKLHTQPAGFDLVAKSSLRPTDHLRGNVHAADHTAACLFSKTA